MEKENVIIESICLNDTELVCEPTQQDRIEANLDYLVMLSGV